MQTRNVLERHPSTTTISPLMQGERVLLPLLCAWRNKSDVISVWREREIPESDKAILNQLLQEYRLEYSVSSFYTVSNKQKKTNIVPTAGYFHSHKFKHTQVMMENEINWLLFR